MPFTDDNLEWVKRITEGCVTIDGQCSDDNKISCDRLVNLIARLEAAEAVLEPHEDGCGVSVNLDCTCDMPKRWDVWRKAAGRI